MIRWTDYMKFRLELRGFDPAKIEQILRFSDERYIDAATGRFIAVGRHQNVLVMIPYEQFGNEIVPVTAHTTSREQINMRVRSGRLSHE